MNILVSRTDRLGDVMMALPTLKYLRETLTEAAIDFCCSESFRKLLLPFLKRQKVTWVQKPQWESRKYQAVLFLNEDRFLFREAAKAKVPFRVGNRSRWLSFFSLTHSFRQKRSQAVKNEAEYSLDLGHYLAQLLLGRSLPQPQVVTGITLDSERESSERAHQVLQSLGIFQDFAVLHPGMGGGSALNLSVRNYLQVVRALQRRYGVPVLLSEGPARADRELVFAIQQELEGMKVIRGESLEVVAEVFRKAKVVAAPSTGPLHLAHYVGTCTIGFYSPVLSQRVQRWAVWGGTGNALSFCPAVPCPGKTDCVGKDCLHYFCMETLDWGSLILGSGDGLNKF